MGLKENSFSSSLGSTRERILRFFLNRIFLGLINELGIDQDFNLMNFFVHGSQTDTFFVIATCTQQASQQFFQNSNGFLDLVMQVVVLVLLPRDEPELHVGVMTADGFW